MPFDTNYTLAENESFVEELSSIFDSFKRFDEYKLAWDSSIARYPHLGKQTKVHNRYVISTDSDVNIPDRLYVIYDVVDVESKVYLLSIGSLPYIQNKLVKNQTNPKY